MPYCSFVLAEMGADVIKIERPPTGDVVRGWDSAVGGLSTGFVWVNANKRDIAVDLNRDEGRVAVQRLVAGADVFLENFTPGVAARLGLGAPSLCAANRRLVYCSLSGYGQTGPYRDRKSYDLLMQGEAGVIATTGYPEAPAKVGIPICDLAAGGNAALAVVLALFERERSGRGQVIDVAMFDSILSWLGYYPQHFWHTGTEPQRSGMRHQYICPYGPFLAADGRLVNLVVASDEDWKIFCARVADKSEWEFDSRFVSVRDRLANRAVLENLVEKLIATETAAEWERRMHAARLPFGAVNGIGQVLDHPQVEARRLVVNADSPVGELRLVRFALAPADGRRRIPALGEHTDELLIEAGYSPAEIRQLHLEGVVA
jgi:crotonobetainyl-CoA:carnitine CoA-transferase CaiB-like acyl-CoA transferase